MISAHMFSAQTMLCSPRDAYGHPLALVVPGTSGQNGPEKEGRGGGVRGGPKGNVGAVTFERLTAVRNTRRAEVSGMCSALNLLMGSTWTSVSRRTDA